MQSASRTSTRARSSVFSGTPAPSRRWCRTRSPSPPGHPAPHRGERGRRAPRARRSTAATTRPSASRGGTGSPSPPTRRSGRSARLVQQGIAAATNTARPKHAAEALDLGSFGARLKRRCVEPFYIVLVHAACACTYKIHHLRREPRERQGHEKAWTARVPPQVQHTMTQRELSTHGQLI